MEWKNELLDKAYQIAMKAHEGQIDKAGKPYIQHPLHVAEDVETNELKVIALLHDVIEDSEYTREELLKEGIPEKLVNVVCLLSHDPNLSYMDYVRLIGADAMARKVKMADLRHNMDISRIPYPEKKDYDRLKRYQEAYAFLEEADQKKEKV